MQPRGRDTDRSRESAVAPDFPNSDFKVKSISANSSIDSPIVMVAKEVLEMKTSRLGSSFLPPQKIVNPGHRQERGKMERLGSPNDSVLSTGIVSDFG